MPRGGYFEDNEVFDDDQQMLPIPSGSDDYSQGDRKKSIGARRASTVEENSYRSMSPSASIMSGRRESNASPLPSPKSISRKQSTSGSYLQQPLASSGCLDDMDVEEEGFVSFDDDVNEVNQPKSKKSNKKRIAIIILLLLLLSTLIIILSLVLTSGDDHDDNTNKAPVDHKTAVPITETTSPKTSPSSGYYRSANSIVVHGDLAFIGKASDGLFVVNISSPGSPQLLGSLVGINIEQVVITSDGDSIIATDRMYGGVHIIQVSVPTSPKRISSFETRDENSNKSLTISIHKDTLCISDEATGLFFIDISDKTNPNQYSSLFSPSAGTPTDTYISDEGLAYVLRSGVLSIVDTTIKSTPLVISAPSELYSKGVGISIKTSLDSSTKTAYIIDEVGLLHIIDVTDPTQPLAGPSSIDFSGNDDKKTLLRPLVSSASPAMILPSEEQLKVNCKTEPSLNGLLISCFGQLQFISHDSTGNYSVSVLEAENVITFSISNGKLYVLKSDGLSVFDWTHYIETPPTTTSRDVRTQSTNSNDISHLKNVFIKLFNHLSQVDIDLSDYGLTQTDLANTIDAKNLVVGLKTLLQLTPKVEGYFGLFNHLQGVPTLEGLADIVQNNIPTQSSDYSLKPDYVYAGNFDSFSDELVVRIQLKAISHKSSQQIFLADQLHGVLKNINKLTELFEFLNTPSVDINIPNLSRKTSFEATSFIDVTLGLNIASVKESKKLSEDQLLSKAFIRINSYEAGVKVVIDPLEFDFSKVFIKDGLCSLALGVKPSEENVKYPSPKTFMLSELDGSSLPELLLRKVSPKPYATLDVELPVQFKNDAEPGSSNLTPIIELRDSNLLDGKLHAFDLDVDLEYLISNGLIKRITDSLDLLLADVTSIGVQNSVDSSAITISNSLLSGIDKRINFTSTLNTYVSLLKKYRKMENDQPVDLKLDAAGMGMAQSEGFQKSLLQTLGFDSQVVKLSEKFPEIQLYYKMISDIGNADPNFDVEKLGWYLSVKPEHQLTRSNSRAILSVLPSDIQTKYQKLNTHGYPVDSSGVVFDPTNEAYLPKLTSILGGTSTFTAVQLGKALSEIRPTLGKNDEFQLEMFYLLKNRFPVVMSRYEQSPNDNFPTDPITSDKFDWEIYLQEIATVFGMGNTGLNKNDLSVLFGKTPTIQGLLSFVKNIFKDSMRDYFVDNVGVQTPFEFEGHIVSRDGHQLLLMELIIDFTIPGVTSSGLINPFLESALGKLGLVELVSSFEDSFTTLQKNKTTVSADLLLDVEAGVQLDSLWIPSNGGVTLPSVFVNVSKLEIVASVSTSSHSSSFEFGSGVSFGITDASLNATFNLTAAIPKGHPVVVISDDQNMKFSLSSVFDAIHVSSSFNLTAPVQFPLLTSPVIISLDDRNLFDDVSPVLSVTSEGFPVSMSISQSPKVVEEVVVDFMVETKTGIMSLPVSVIGKTTFTAEAIQKTLLEFSLSTPVTCPISVVGAVTKLVEADSKMLAAGGVSTVSGALVSLESMTINPCVVAVKDSLTSFFSMKLRIGSVLSVNNLSIEDLRLEVSGKLTSTSAVVVTTPISWIGSVNANTVVFDIPCLLKGSMDNSWGLTNMLADCTIHTKLFTLSTEVEYTSERCSSVNKGQAKLEIPTIGLTATGDITERTGCGSDNKPEYDIQMKASDVFVQGVTLVSPELSVSHTAVTDSISGMVSREWSGRASGDLSIGSHTTLAATLIFDDKTITSFDTTGILNMGPLAGTVSASITNGLVTGSGIFDITLMNGIIPQLSATFQHVSTYTTSNADIPLWSVNGSLTAFDIYGITLAATNVNITGAYKDTTATADDVTWTGSVTAEGRFLDNSNAQFRAEIRNDEFSSLWANITLDGPSIKFSGEAEITSDHQINKCSAIEAEGQLFITGLDRDKTIDFESTALYNDCAGIGEVGYSLEATVNTTIEVFSGLSIKDLSVSVESRVAKNDNNWKATVQGTANIFGMTSHAAVVWENGKISQANIQTAFTTTNGLLSAKLEFDYIDECRSSKGSSEFLIRLKDLSDLTITGDVSYNKCTGVVEVIGSTIHKWKGPSGTTYNGISVVITSSDNGGDVNAKLATRDWIGSISGTSSSGFLSQLSFDTKNGTVDGMVTYEDDNLSLVVAVGTSNCTGRGTAILKDLPHNIPAIELDVSFSRPGCVEPSWIAEGSIRQVIIPFNSKVLIIDRMTVTITNDKHNKKKVEIVGEFMDGDFAVKIEFGVSPLTEVTLIGEKKSVTPISISSFTSKWYSTGSSSPFSTNSADPSTQKSVTATSLNNVKLEISFHEKLLSVTANGFLFGLSWNVAVGIQHEGSKWKFGGYIETSNFTGRTETPDLVDKVINGLLPASLSLSIANEDIHIQGNTIRKGLCVRIVLAESSSHIQQVVSSAPSSFKTQIAAAKKPAVSNGVAGFILQADIITPKDITLYVMLAGNIRLTDGVYFRSVGMAFKIQTVPEMGFMAEIDFTVGKGVHQQVLTAGGFVGLDLAGTISVGLSLDSSQPWVSPFGINGVEVLFPLGIEMGISFTGYPTSFAFIGGMQIGGVYGKIVIGVDLIDFTKTAFKGEVGGLSLRRLIVGVGECDKCIPSELDDLIDGTALESLSGSFNPDPFHSVAIHAGTVYETIDAGITIEIKNLQFLGVLHIQSGKFKLNSHGIDTGLQLAPVHWGPLHITAPGDESKGPGFELLLSPTKQKVSVYGQITVLGMRAMLDLSVGSRESHGKFSLMVAGLEVSVALLVRGKPGDKDFRNVIEGSMSLGYMNHILDKAGEYFQKLADKAAAALEEKQKKFEAAAETVRSAKAKLEEAKESTSSKLKAARDKVTKYRHEKQQATCPNKCTRGWLGIPNCWGMFKCWVTKQAVKLLVVAEKALSAVEVIAVGAIELAQGVLTAAEVVLEITAKALELAKIGMKKFSDLINKYGSLSKIFSIQRLGFKSTLTSDDVALNVYADLIILGRIVNIEFTSELTFEAIFKSVIDPVIQYVL